MEEMVFINNTFLPVSEAKISINDYGFLYGFGVFETMRAYYGRVFKMDAHLERLKKSAEYLGIPIQVSKLKEQVNETIRLNRLSEARVRVYITSGEGGTVPNIRSCKNPTLVIKAVCYAPFPPEVYEEGFKVIISAFHRYSRSVLPGIKSANCLENLLVRQEAEGSGCRDAILLNEKGMVAETASSNIFVISDDVLRTPGTESGILAGITREVVLKLANGLGMKSLETDIAPAEVLSAGEVFLTNSMMELMPVTVMGDKIIGSGKPGVVTRKLMAAYRELVKKETQ